MAIEKVETVSDVLLAEIKSVFDDSKQPYHVILSTDVEGFSQCEEEGFIYTIRDGDNLLGCALVKPGEWEPEGLKERIQENQPITIIDRIEIRTDSRLKGLGSVFLDGIIKKHSGPYVVYSVQESYDFWCHQGFVPVTEGDTYQETYLFKI